MVARLDMSMHGATTLALNPKRAPRQRERRGALRFARQPAGVLLARAGEREDANAAKPATTGMRKQ